MRQRGADHARLRISTTRAGCGAPICAATRSSPPDSCGWLQARHGHLIGIGTPRGLQGRVAAVLATLGVLMGVVRRFCIDSGLDKMASKLSEFLGPPLSGHI